MMQQAQAQELAQNQNMEMNLRETLLGQSGPSGSSTGPQTYPPPPSASAPPPDNPYQNSDSASPHSNNNLDPNVTGSSQQMPYGMANDSAGDDMAGLDAKGKRELSTSKRAAQNRAAQRAFRQRKEGYIKKLEEQVKEFQSMEQSYRALQHENYQLREYILNLQSRLLENQSDFPPAPSHINLASSAAAAAANSHVEHTSTTEQQLRRELQQQAVPSPLAAQGPEPPRQAPVDHLGAAARAVDLDSRRSQESPYGLGSDYPNKRIHTAAGDTPMADAKSR